MKNPEYLVNIDDVSQIDPEVRQQLSKVQQSFIYRSNSYYQGLIDWTNEADPILHIVTPIPEELEDWGKLDASNEMKYTVVPGLEHKYRNTALLLVNDICAAYCRFCFRKRLFMDDNTETTRDIAEGAAYIHAHEEITNVLLTGGDPLVMSTRKLEPILNILRAIDHVSIIRIGTKVPAFNPSRILNDRSLPQLLERHSSPTKKIYIMAHFNHPRELTPEAIAAIEVLQKAGAVTVNQTPLIRRVNDNPEVLGELLDRLSFTGITPYYVFQCRPTLGNRPYVIPVEEAYEIFLQAQERCSGLAKRSRFIISHETGKIEVVGLTETHIYMRYHQAVAREDLYRLLVFKRDPLAYWLDDYTQRRDAESANEIEAGSVVNADGARATVNALRGA
jgi:lysine 2,3-aminomutase